MNFIDRLRNFMGVDENNNPIVKKEDTFNSRWGITENVTKVSEYSPESFKLGNKQLTYLKEIQSVFLKKTTEARVFYEKRYGVSHQGLKDIISNKYYFEHDKPFLNNLKEFHIDVVIPYQKHAEKLSKEFDGIERNYGMLKTNHEFY